ncbi:hypothetical protein CFP56_023298, partial [Quercus suber]
MTDFGVWLREIEILIEVIKKLLHIRMGLHRHGLAGLILGIIAWDRGNRGIEKKNNARKQQRGETCREYSKTHIGKIALETEKKLEFLKEFEGSIIERFLSSSNIEELKAVDVSIGPLILTRCKSDLEKKK